MPLQSQLVANRLVGLFEHADGWRDAAALVDAIGASSGADAVLLEEAAVRDRPTPTYVDASLQQRHGAVVDVLGEVLRNMPSPMDYPYPVHWPEVLAGAHPDLLAVLAEDSFIERLAITTPDTEYLGTLTLLGASSRGCPPLAEAERRILRNVCYPYLQVARETQRVERLESDLRFMGAVSQGLAARASTHERLKRAVVAIQQLTGFESVQVVTWNPGERDSLLNVLFLRDAGFVPDNTWDTMTPAEIKVSSQRFLHDPSPLFVADPAGLPNAPPEHRRWMRSHAISFLVFVPLVFADEHLGTVVLTSRFPREATEERVRAITNLGGHLAAVLQLALLLTEVQDSYRELRASGRNTVETLALAAEMRDATTGRHMQRLRELSVALGRQLQLRECDLEDLGYAAAVHDIGKLEIADAILLKPDALTSDEWAVMRNHTVAGEQLLRWSDVPQVVRDVVRWHHERWDGAGYPDGLAGDEIPLSVQIVSVADAFDALTSRRPYKEPWPIKRALAEIRRGSGTQFSPDVVDALLAIPDTLLLSDIDDTI